MLGNGHYEVRTVSLTTGAVTSIGGFRVLPDYSVYSIPSDYEALILIGGMSWRNEETGKIKPLIEKCLANGKILGGICDASAFLGKAGAPNNVRHTSNDRLDLKQWAGESYTGEEHYVMQQAVSDKNIITANGTAALEFAREVLLTLKAALGRRLWNGIIFINLGCMKLPCRRMQWNGIRRSKT